jgi:hypothetical protein
VRLDACEWALPTVSGLPGPCGVIAELMDTMLKSNPRQHGQRRVKWLNVLWLHDRKLQSFWTIAGSNETKKSSCGFMLKRQKPK